MVVQSLLKKQNMQDLCENMWDFHDFLFYWWNAESACFLNFINTINKWESECLSEFKIITVSFLISTCFCKLANKNNLISNKNIFIYILSVSIKPQFWNKYWFVRNDNPCVESCCWVLFFSLQTQRINTQEKRRD